MTESAVGPIFDLDGPTGTCTGDGRLVLVVHPCGVDRRRDRFPGQPHGTAVTETVVLTSIGACFQRTGARHTRRA